MKGPPNELREQIRLSLHPKDIVQIYNDDFQEYVDMEEDYVLVNKDKVNILKLEISRAEDEEASTCIVEPQVDQEKENVNPQIIREITRNHQKLKF